MPENWHGGFFLVEREVKNKKADDGGWGPWKSLGSDLMLPLIHEKHCFNALNLSLKNQAR